MANQTSFHLESDYAYVLGEATGKLLDLELVLSRPGDFLQIDLQHIANEMESTAKYFAEMQGFNTSGQLYQHIKAEPTSTGVILTDDAQNERLHFYAGHQEFGFHTRAGRFKEGRPFLRPAVRAVTLASTGKLSSAALEVANFSGGTTRPTFNKNGFIGNNLGRIRAFYRSDNYTVKGLEKKLGTADSHLTSWGRRTSSTATNMGKSYTINRRTSEPTGLNHYVDSSGYRYAQKWDAPYSGLNSYKMERISRNWD